MTLVTLASDPELKEHKVTANADNTVMTLAGWFVSTDPAHPFRFYIQIPLAPDQSYDLTESTQRGIVDALLGTAGLALP